MPRRVWCHLFTAGCAISLLLCATTCLLWARSLGHVGGATWITSMHQLELWNAHGVVGAEFAWDTPLPRPGTDPLNGWFAWRSKIMQLRDGTMRDRASLLRPSFNAWGFGIHLEKTVGRPRGNWTYGDRRLFILFLPYWLLTLVLAVPPALVTVRLLRRARRRRDGRCIVCGYDLRASPERCPECGAANPCAV